MYYLVYTSYTHHHMPEDELKSLLKTSVKNNKKLGITGLMLYSEKKFIQILEGEKEVVSGLFEKIKKDSRHDHVTLLIEGTIQQRNYPDWSMAFKSYSGSELMKVLGFEDIEEYFETHPLTDESHVSSVFMQLFFNRNHRSINQI